MEDPPLLFTDLEAGISTQSAPTTTECNDDLHKRSWLTMEFLGSEEEQKFASRTKTIATPTSSPPKTPLIYPAVFEYSQQLLSPEQETGTDCS
jgi:hypothetical protein